MALVAPVGWLMLRSSNINCVCIVVWLSKSCSQRAPTMLRRSVPRWRPAWSAVCATVGAENPLANRLTVAHPGASGVATTQPRWNGLARNWLRDRRTDRLANRKLLIPLTVILSSGVGA